MAPPFVNATTETCSAVSSERRRVFVAAAHEAFFAEGYSGTSMSSIAARVGGSKTTLWTYFPSKQALFSAVVDEIVEQYGTALSIELPDDEPVEIVLRRFGTALLDTVLSEPIVALHRLVMGEVVRFPELADMFYERGAKRGQARLSAYLERAMKRDLLRNGDAPVLARQFAGMCLSGCFQLALLGIDKQPTQFAISKDIDAAVDATMRAWGNVANLEHHVQPKI
jgi:TetR/AcrR family transcriptional regulator, mexJK operon transcriptional repressor